MNAAVKESTHNQQKDTSDQKEKKEKLEIKQNECIPQNIRDQIQRQIEDWKKKDELFVSTRASDYIMECLQNSNCLTITAPSGAGKSFIAIHTVLVLRDEGYNIIPVIQPSDIRDYYQPGEPTVFIVDDICGNFTANQQQIENWKQQLPVINMIIADKCCKIIVSCRLQVYNDDKFNTLLPFKSCECNLISNKLCLTSIEKKSIASKYIGTGFADLDKLSENSDLFPLLCSLYKEKKHGDVNKFFNNPYIVYEKEIENLSMQGDEGKCKKSSLALLVIFNNQLREKWFQGRITNEQTKIIKDTCEACGINSIPKINLKTELDTLVGTFVSKQDGIYRTIHDKLFDILAYYFGQTIIDCLIEHGESELVHERFIWQTSPNDENSNIDFIIEISDDHSELYLERFIKDWLGGKVAVVFSNTNMKVSSFRQQLIQYVQQLDKVQQVKIANTKDTVEPMESCDFGTTPLVWNCYDGYTDMVQWLLSNDVNVDQCRDDGVSGLFMASQKGHTDIVKLLLERNPDVNLCDNDGVRPLFMASQNGHTDIVELLLERNLDVNLCDKVGCSPLFIASQQGHNDIVKLLLEINPDVNLCDNDGCSPLFIASQQGHTDIVKLLLERNPDVNLCNNDGRSPLILASQNGHTDIVKLLLERNPDVNLCNKNGSSPLLQASDGGHTDIVKLLLGRNSDVNLCNKDGWSPLLLASQNGHTDIVKLLLERNPDVNLCSKDGFSPLLQASDGGHTDIVKLLLERNADVNLCNNDGCSPLLLASQNGHTDIVKLLLGRNPDVNLCNKDGWSPLILASDGGHTDIVKLLLERNPDVNLCNNDGCSPLLLASDGGHTDIVKLLLERNPDVNLCNKDGCSPLLQASQDGHTDIVKFLLERNPDVNLCDKDGCSPLLQASDGGHTDIVKFLLERNPDVNFCNTENSSPLLKASQSGHTDIVKLLLERNPDVNLCDNIGCSPLIQASCYGHTDIVKLLLERNPDPCDNAPLSEQEKEIGQWRKRLENFEETFASKAFYNTVITGRFVIISGPPGSGKSAIAYNTALMLEKNKEYKILPVSSPEEIRNYLLPETKQVFLIDDPVGKYTVDDSCIQKWKKEETFIKQTFSDCSTTKLILTCRSYIYKSGFCRKLQFSPIHCDLLSDDLKLSFEERKQFVHRYNIPELIEDSIMLYYFFPLLCLVSSRQVNPTSVFVNPIKVLREEMNNTKEKSDIAFLAIALLVVLDNNIDSEMIRFENTTIKEMLYDLCNECGLTFFPSITVLLEALSDLIGTYVKKTDNGFACIHNTLFQNLSFIVGSSIIHCLLKYGNCKFIAHRLQLASIQQMHGELVIIVKPEQEELYFERILLDIRKGNHSVVFTGIQMKLSRFRSKLHKCLKSLKDIDVTCDDNNSTPLHIVSEQGYEDLVFTLYKIKKDQINHQDNSKRTPLFMACLGGHDKVIQTILGIDHSSLHMADSEDLMPLDAASLNDHSSTVTLLLKRDANINRKDKTLKRTAFQRACDSGSIKVVSELLTYKPDIKNTDIHGLKALHIACKRGHLNIVKILLEYKDMTNECDANGRTPLWTACESNQQDIVRLLLENKANVNQTDVKKISPLYIACQIGSDNIVGVLLDNFAKVNIKSDNGYSPLHVASMKGKLKCVEILLDKNAETDLATKQGWTAFFLSCSKGHLDICKLLHFRGANVNVCDKSANTPLHVACRANHECIVRFLIDHDANVNAVNTSKESPMFIACGKECFDVVQLLIDSHADVNIYNEKGNSPLHVACIKGNKPIVRLLLDQKANIQKRNKVGKTPFDIVQEKKNDTIVDMFNSHEEK
ncbi:Hypothetical predicted protein [Mytilus galloprovincialis]|uniref:Novel STAND NTPase 3 domain-containing protein n=1 Tax=Mytilus galloprovincialis TaxID=29158 RepID=A0A8B6DR74_MYTGA|nr:Hypothetical predicted protein [Mytilus galloprovincialis]